MLDAGHETGAKGAMLRLLGRKPTTTEMPLRNLRRPVSARIEDLNDDIEDDRGL